MKEKEKGRTDDDNIELEPSFQKFMFDLSGNGIETDVRRRSDLFGCLSRHRWGC